MCSRPEIVLAITCNRQGETRLIINFRAFFSILISRCENQLSMSGSRRESYTELIVLSISAKRCFWRADDSFLISTDQWNSVDRETLSPIPDATNIQKCRSVNQRQENDAEKTELPWKDKAVFCHYFHWFTFKIPDYGSARNYTFNRRKLNEVSCAKIKEEFSSRGLVWLVLRILQLCSQSRGFLIHAQGS